MSDVKIYLVQAQYCDLLKISRALTHVLDKEIDQTIAFNTEEQSPKHIDISLGGRIAESDGTDLMPEVKAYVGNEPMHLATRTFLELSASLSAVRLYLYDTMTAKQQDLKDHGVVRFALNETSLSLKILSDDAMEIECSIHSFTVNNTKPGPSRFREIIPVARHGRNQLMMLYTSSGGSHPTALAVANIDSPQVIFSLDPVFAVVDFFLSAFPADLRSSTVASTGGETSHRPGPQQDHLLGIRLDIHNISVVILQDDTDAHSQAVEIALKQCSVSRQVYMLSDGSVYLGLIQLIGYNCVSCPTTTHVACAHGQTV